MESTWVPSPAMKMMGLLVTIVLLGGTVGASSDQQRIVIGVVTEDGFNSLSQQDFVSSVQNYTELLEASYELVNRTVNVTYSVEQVNLENRDIQQKVCSLLSMSAAVIVTFTSCQVTLDVQNILKEHNVPLLYFQQCPHIKQFEPASTAALVPVLPEVTMVINAVVQNEKWTDVVILYDDQNDLVQGLVSALSEVAVPVKMYHMTPATSLLHASLVHNHYYIVWCGFNATLHLLQQVRFSNLEIIGPDYQWLLVDGGDFDQEELASVLVDGDNVALLHQNSTLTQILSSQKNAMEVALSTVNSMVMSDDNLSLPNTTCSQPQPWQHGQAFSQAVKHYWKEDDPHLHSNWYVLSSLHSSDNGGRQDFSQVGGWLRSEGLELRHHLFPRLYQGYNNRTFIVTTLHKDPFVIRYDNASYDGLVFEILNELAHKLNFSYEVREPADGLWGIEGPDGKFSGMMGMIQRKEVDFGVGTFTINKEREKVADFLVPFMADPTIILIQKPDLATAKIFICLGPFDLYVWITLIISVIVTGLICWFVTWSDPQVKKEDKENNPLYSASINMWQTFGAMLQQGMVVVPTSHSSRTIISFWWLYTLVVVGTYNGNLIAFLTAPNVETNIHSIDDLATSNMPVGFVAETAIHQLFRDAPSGTVYHNIYKRIQGKEDLYLYRNNEDGIRRVLHDRDYAFITGKSVYDTLHPQLLGKQNNSCELTRADKTFFTEMYAFPFAKDSPYVEKFSLELLRLLEAGLISRWKTKWYPLVNQCAEDERNTEEMNISLAEAQGAFYLLAIGLFVAAVALFAEKVQQYSAKYLLSRSQENQDTSTVNYVESNTVMMNRKINNINDSKSDNHRHSNGVHNKEDKLGFYYNPYEHLQLSRRKSINNNYNDNGSVNDTQFSYVYDGKLVTKDNVGQEDFAKDHGIMENGHAKHNGNIKDVAVYTIGNIVQHKSIKANNSKHHGTK